MSEQAKTARAAMKAKAQRLGGKTDPHQKVDASSWTPSEPEAGSSQTGMRPVSPRQYKRGGKVVGKHEGAKAKHHMGRKPRKAGGQALTPNNLINRNVKEANQERAGTKHIGGLKTGGRAGHPDEAEDRALVKKMVKGEALTGKKHGGIARKHRDRGGSTTQRNLAKYFGDDDTSPSMGPGPEEPDVAGARYFQKTGRQPQPLNAPSMMGPAAEQPLPVRARGGKAPEKWIQGAIKHPGALHKALHVPAGEKIPAKKLKKAEHSSNPTMAKRARLAETLKGMQHAHGGAAGHGVGCGCAKCMGGKVRKARGGQAEEVTGTRPTGGRMARKAGGRTKGKTNINIVISPHEAHTAPQAGMMPPPGAMPPRPAMPVPVPPPTPMGGMPPGGMPPGGAMPMPMPMPAAQPPAAMPRKRGGRTTYPKMRYGAGSGEGRLEKIEEYGE